jgi:class 3 adenylate cyclase
MAICTRCGVESPSGFRFCGACGAELPEAGRPDEARKVVTTLFCDAAGSTALGEELDPEAFRNILRHYFEAITAIVERHGGTVQKYAGDAVLAVFGIPRVEEDDALRAVRAAVEIRDTLPSIVNSAGGAPLAFRIGINTGLVVTDIGKSLALGDAVNVASRLEQAAAPGEILIGAETLRMVRNAVEVLPLEPLSVKGKSEPVEAFRLLTIDPLAPGLARRTDVALVDRHRELATLMTLWERAVAESACQLVILLGVAGVGKSRLVDELITRIGEGATVLRGRCLHYGDGITFWPIVDALTPLGEIAEPILDHVSTGGAATPEELFLEVRRLLESLARERPLILHIDDMQWAEPMMFDLLDHVASLSRHAPLLVLCTARRELLEEHPEWARGRPNSTVVQLEALANADCQQLLDELGGELDGATRERVITTSEGNPLFLQEMVVLARERGAVDIPPTIQAVLAARLERLSTDERELLARGAVEGLVFHRSAVEALVTAQPPTDVDAHLDQLVRKDLIRPHPTDVPGDKAFRFRHLLIRDAAYERLPKVTRADLHARYADWLDRSAVDYAEVDEIAGWHLEQAIHQEREVHREVESTLTTRAAERLYAAGRRAGDRSDVGAARNLLERALSLAPSGSTLHTNVSIGLAERLIESGDLGRADALLSAIESAGDELGPASLARLEWMVFSQPEDAKQMIESRLPPLLDRLAGSGDDRGQAKAHWLAFWAQWSASRATLAGEQARLSAEHARRAGDIGMWSRALGWYVATLIYGPRGAAEIASELDAIDAQAPGPYLSACVDLGRAEVARLEGSFAQARGLAERAFEVFGELGMPAMAAISDQSLAAIELSAGRPEEAITALLRTDAILAEAGERGIRSTTQAMLARAHEGRGATAAAHQAIALAEELSGPADLLNFAYTDGVRAALALAELDLDGAEQRARSAVEHASKTDFLGLQADASLCLARALAARGDRHGSRLEARRAIELFESKGDQPGREQAKAAFAGLGA